MAETDIPTTLGEIESAAIRADKFLAVQVRQIGKGRVDSEIQTPPLHERGWWGDDSDPIFSDDSPNSASGEYQHRHQ